LSKNQANCNKIYNIKNVNLRIQCINTEILITEMGLSDEAKNVIPLKFLRTIKNKKKFPLVNSIRGQLYIRLLTTMLLEITTVN
jgi:hypothetical protein